MKQINEYLVNANVSKFKSTYTKLISLMQHAQDVAYDVISDNIGDDEFMFDEEDPIAVVNIEDYSSMGFIRGFRKSPEDELEVYISWINKRDDYDWEPFHADYFHVDDLALIIENIIVELKNK